MTIYAYLAKLTPTNTPTEEQLEARRGEVRRLIGSWGGDPLPGEQILVRLNPASVVLMQWRSKQSPVKELLETITEYAQGLDIQAWSLDYHVCGNGVHRPCGRWHRLIEG